MECASASSHPNPHPLEKVVARLLDQSVTTLNWDVLLNRYALSLVWRRTLPDPVVDAGLVAICGFALILIVRRLADLDETSVALLLLGGGLLLSIVGRFVYQQEKLILAEPENRWIDSGIGFFVLEQLLTKRLQETMEMAHRIDYHLHVSHFPGTSGAAKMRSAHEALDRLTRCLRDLLAQEDTRHSAAWTVHLQARLPPHAYSTLAPQSREALERIAETLLRVTDELFLVTLAFRETCLASSKELFVTCLPDAHVTTILDAAKSIEKATFILLDREEEPPPSPSL